MCFFFQAEDGIRDLVRSRGLGDVYKRQVHRRHVSRRGVVVRRPGGLPADPQAGGWRRLEDPVSYTHLTLPTSDLV